MYPEIYFSYLRIIFKIYTVSSDKIADGTIGNGVPRELWKQNRCFQPTFDVDMMCPLNPLVGYTFDIMSRSCKFHLESSCTHTSDNFFETHEECVENCKSNEPEPTCSILPEPGFVAKTKKCSSFEYRWYHSKGQCYQFIYTGCGGNANNFPTRESCLHFCSGKGELYPDFPDQRELQYHSKQQKEQLQQDELKVQQQRNHPLINPHALMPYPDYESMMFNQAYGDRSFFSGPTDINPPPFWEDYHDIRPREEEIANSADEMSSIGADKDPIKQESDSKLTSSTTKSPSTTEDEFGMPIATLRDTTDLPSNLRQKQEATTRKSSKNGKKSNRTAKKSASKTKQPNKASGKNDKGKNNQKKSK